MTETPLAGATHQAFDCLDQTSLAVARSAPTEEETAAQQFNRSVPRSPRPGFQNRVLDRLVLAELANLYIYRPEARGSIVRRIMQRVHAAKMGMDAWKVSKKTTGHYSSYRFFHLYRIVRARKPRTVVEFGTGVSTVLVAEVLRLNWLEHGVRGHLYSYEQSPRYHRAFSREMPPELADYVTLTLAPVAVDWFGRYRGIYYRAEIPREADVVYVDGATRTRGCSVCDFNYPRVNGDLVRMVTDGCKVGLAVTDHRWANYPFFRDHLPDYSVRVSHLWRSIIVTPLPLRTGIRTSRPG